MCGLAGIIDPSGKKTKNDTRIMAQAIAYRGPDDQTDWQDDTLPVSLSFRRLAILDLSPDGNQPMHEGALTICFNGEIYNYKELKIKLEAEHQCVFKTSSDTEVLLKAFLHWGIKKTLNAVNGMYGIALLDRRDNMLTLMRDRFGEKPLYYTHQNGALYFASELKALRTQINFKASKQGLSYYLQFGFIPAPYTIYEGVKALQPGEYITFDLRNLSHPEDARGPSIIPAWIPKQVRDVSEPEGLENFESALSRSIDIRLRADVPVGVFLSGGLDSSLILLIASKKLGRPLPSFTIKMHSDDPAYDEADQAAGIASLCGSENHVLTLDEEALLEALPAQLNQMDQPLADAAILPTALLSQFARQHVTVVLGGEGGDELQAGYTRHAEEARLKELYTIRSVLKIILPLLKPFAMMGEKIALPQWRRQFDKMQRLLSFKTDNVYEALMTLWDPASFPHIPVQAGISEYKSSLEGEFRQNDTNFYLPHDLLMKLDGATMGASLEGRCPYLDPDLWNVLGTMPKHIWANKRLATDLLVKLGGEDALPRGKRGLTLPLADWLRGGLKDWAWENLEYFKTLNLLPPADIDAQWHAVQDRATDHAQPLWALCIFSAWARAHNLVI